MFRGIIQVYLESVFNNEIVAWYISYLDQGPGSRENYPLFGLKCRKTSRDNIFFEREVILHITGPTI